MGDRGVRDPEPVNCPGDNTPSTPCLLVRTGDIIPDFAVAPNGDLYAVWQTHRSATVLDNSVDDTILLSRSTVKVNHTPSGFNEQALTASVQVAPSGDVAVTYYDSATTRRATRRSAPTTGSPTAMPAATRSRAGSARTRAG
jgi:hypothetical protein